jgi:acyl-CoA-binding protein
VPGTGASTASSTITALMGGGGGSASASAGGASASGGPRLPRQELFESIADLKTAFLEAVAFCRPLLSSDSAVHPAGSRVDHGITSPTQTLSLSDADKLSFYAYFKQATAGDCPEPSHEDDVSMMTGGGGGGGGASGASSGTARSGGTPRGPHDTAASPSSAAGAAAAAGSAPATSPSSHSQPVPGAHVTMDATALAVAKAKRDAWRQCGAMRRRDAMRAFVLLLDQTVPGWDKRAEDGAGEEGNAERM